MPLKPEPSPALEHYGCIMLGLDVNMEAVQAAIDEDDVYVDPDAESADYTGLITYPHVTLPKRAVKPLWLCLGDTKRNSRLVCN